MFYDAIVVGLGPAGATAAYELARRGFSVLAIEKAKLPRYKPCGGALSARIDKILNSGFKSVVEKNISGICLSYQGEDAIHHISKKPVCYMVMRDRFDYYLTEKAEQEGARVSMERVMKVSEKVSSVQVITDSGSYEGGIVIGADGAGSSVARSLGLNKKKKFAYLVKGEVKIPPRSMETAVDEIRFDMGSIPHGYGWIFPKADHLSVGVGGFGSRCENPFAYYSGFMEKCVPDVTETFLKRRCALSFFNDAADIWNDRCMLLGDAASLVDPFTGEGIYYAVRSAQIAAGVMEAGQEFSEYGARIDNEIYKEFRYAARVGRVFYSAPKLVHGILKRNPEFMEMFAGLSRGDIGYEEMWNGVKNRVLKEMLSFSGLRSFPGVLEGLV